MRRVLSIVCLTVLLLAAPGAASAQSDVQIRITGLEIDFGRSVTVHASIQAPGPVQQVDLLLRGADESETRMIPAVLFADGSMQAVYDASSGTLRPFGRISFWVRVQLTDGGVYSSPEFFFRYVDNRFPWQTLEQDGVRVHWYEGGADFGQAALDAARAGLRSFEEILPVTLSAPVDVYIYHSTDTLQATLRGQDWVAGHASPDLGVVMVAIPPGETQSLAMQTQIPHELAHVLLYQTVGPNYARLPVWLREGLAVNAELYPNPDFERALRVATENGSLLSFNELCLSFPPDASRAFTAYAQAASFTTWVQKNYGQSGLIALLSAYDDGLDCEQGAARALSLPLSQMEALWREQELGENRLGVAVRNLLPYALFLLLALLLPLIGLFSLRKGRKR